MTPDLLLALGFGALCGGALAVWRTWAFARKLIHLGVQLDAWADYDEKTRQAHGQARRDNVTPLRGRETDR